MPTRRKQKNLVQTLVSDEMLAALEREQERRSVSMSQLLREIIYQWTADWDVNGQKPRIW